MALKKTVEQENGIVSKYWSIGTKDESFKDRAYTITLFGYATEKTKRDGKQPLDAKVIQIGTGKAYKPDLTRAELYKLIKKHPDWTDATDLK